MAALNKLGELASSVSAAPARLIINCFGFTFVAVLLAVFSTGRTAAPITCTASGAVEDGSNGFSRVGEREGSAKGVGAGRDDDRVFIFAFALGRGVPG